MEIILRGVATLLGLGFILGGVWGPGIQFDGILSGGALLMRAFASDRQIASFWVFSVNVAAIIALLFRGYLLMRDAVEGGELFLLGIIFTTSVGILIDAAQKHKFKSNGPGSN
jgi:hypothetical protein